MNTLPADTLPRLLHHRARTHADAPAVVHADAPALDFAGLAARVTDRARTLQADGIAPGDWVALRTRTDLQGLVDLLAVPAAGACLLPIHPRMPATPLDTLLRAQAIPWILAEPGATVTATGYGSGGRPPRAEGLHAPCTGVLTSGSTGHPKVAVHSHGNHLYSALGANAVNPLGPGDRYLLSLPTFHVGGLTILVRCLLGGAALVLGGRAEDAAFLERMGVTHVSMVETQLQRLLAGETLPSGLRTVLLGGGPVRPHLLEEARHRGLSCWMSYGLTEMTAQVVTHDPHGRGRILPHRECRVDANGEILVRGDTLFLGYLEDGAIRPATDTQGWFHTRDLGHWEDGRLHITGRADNQFISGGENIQPEAVEAVLHRHPRILRAVVVPRPDAEFGQRPVAFLETDGRVDEPSLRDWLREHLPPYMVPVAFLELEPTPDLKVRRGELARRAAAGHREAP
ncbi:AMP-binding protein [Ectothiorhodospira mobilis]|uniref:AMP-binding protein n=1 Tax=Ectothiorhodospira mobilis TaxID=195064 RepID=UPI001F5B0429|nr:AMP-binding protein [Ectothiorhodospira mobilis]